MIPKQNKNIPFDTFSICQWIKLKESKKIYQITKFENKIKTNPNENKFIISKSDQQKYHANDYTKIISSIEVKIK